MKLGNQTNTIRNAAVLGLSLSLLSTALAGSAGAANIDGNVVFTGAILDACTVTIGGAGLLGVSSNQTVLSSEESGGLAGSANIITNSATSTVEVIPPTGFTLAPTGSNDNTTFAVKYALSGVTSGLGINGTTPTVLGTGATTVTVDASATKSTGTYGAGAYNLITTVRCVTQ